MTTTIRIGNAQAFWGDLPSAARELLMQVPNLDFLTMDYLAEVSMSILAQQRHRNPQLGYPQDFVQVVQSLAGYWAAGGKCRLVANAGGLNPIGCAQACKQVLEQHGCRSLKIGIVSGDDVLPLLMSASGGQINEKSEFTNLDDGRALSAVQDRLVTANAYMGCQGIVQALDVGADIVITGRVADPSMVLAACIHAFGWSHDDWDRLAQGTVAGHLLECGTQATGGISTDWLSIPNPANIGFPVVEIEPNGRCLVTKALGTGGRVTEETVKEQLIYEIGDPGRYLSPDVQVSFLGLQVKQIGDDRVEVVGAKGSERPKTLKVSATYRDGYRAAGSLTVFGHRAADRARRAGEVIVQRLSQAGWTYRDTLIECLGNADSVLIPKGSLPAADSFESVLRIAVEADSKEAVEAFSQTLMSLVTAGPQGTTGYAEGRPRVHSVFRYWPCLVATEKVVANVEFVDTLATLTKGADDNLWVNALGGKPTESQAGPASPAATAVGGTTGRLIDVAYGRSGDKGTGANVGILARNAGNYEKLRSWLTEDRVHDYFRDLGITSIQRFELPNLAGLNFVLGGVLRRGIRNDVQGKALAQALLTMPLDSWDRSV